MAKKSTIALPPARPAPATSDAFVLAGNPIPEPPEDKVKPKRLTIDVAPELHQKFKVAVASSGRDMRDVMTDLIRKYVSGAR